MPYARRARAVLLLLPVVACARHDTGDEAAAASAAGGAGSVVGAETAIATREAFTEIVSAIGTVTARPGYIAALSAPAPTRVMRIFVAIGQHVAVGAPLVEFDRAPFDAQARSAEAALASAEHAYGRAQRLAEAGIVPRKDVDQASADLAQAQSAAVVARRAQSLAILHAPMAGVVTRLDAVLGGSVDAAQTLVEVADPSMLDLLFTVTPADAARIRSGAAVQVTAGQRETGEVLGTATVTDVAATVDTATRGVLVRARLGHPTRSLRIGETIVGQVAVAVHPNAVSVPIAALVPNGDGIKVFVIDSAHRARATPVTVGARSGQRAEITSGLSGGETVVTVGAYGVDDSARVVPIGGGVAVPGGRR